VNTNLDLIIASVVTSDSAPSKAGGVSLRGYCSQAFDARFLNSNTVVADCSVQSSSPYMNAFVFVDISVMSKPTIVTSI